MAKLFLMVGVYAIIEKIFGQIQFGFLKYF